jgi:SAM-dependent methyltransferase
VEGYRADLAHIHDSGYGEFAARAAEQVVAWLRAAGHREGLVVDLGCGGGQSSLAFAAAGYEVFGSDASAALVERARERVPGSRFAVCSFLDAELPPCVAVVAIGEVLTYTFDPRNGRPALAALFGRAHAALRPRGLLVFDVLGPSRRPLPSRTWREGDGWAVLAELSALAGGERLRRRIVTFLQEPDGAWRRGEEVHDVLLLEPAPLLTDLRAAGFRARTRHSYDGGPRHQPGHSVYVARRP